MEPESKKEDAPETPNASGSKPEKSSPDITTPRPENIFSAALASSVRVKHNGFIFGRIWPRPSSKNGPASPLKPESKPSPSESPILPTNMDKNSESKAPENTKSSLNTTTPKKVGMFSAAHASSDKVREPGVFRIGQILYPASWKNGRAPDSPLKNKPSPGESPITPPAASPEEKP